VWRAARSRCLTAAGRLSASGLAESSIRKGTRTVSPPVGEQALDSLESLRSDSAGGQRDLGQQEGCMALAWREVGEVVVPGRPVFQGASCSASGGLD
jgi:hypothetical protein